MSDITEKPQEENVIPPTTPPDIDEPKIPVAPAAAKNEGLSNGKASASNTPPQMLQDFLDAHGLELRLTPPRVRNMQDGGLLIDPPLVVVNFRQAAPVVPAKPNN